MAVCLFCIVALVAYVRKQGNLTCTLDRGVQIALVLCASAGNTTGKDLCTLRNKLSQLCNILVIDGVDLVHTENANLLLSVYGTEGTRILVCSLHETVQNLSDPKIQCVPTEPGAWQGRQPIKSVECLLRRAGFRRHP